MLLGTLIFIEERKQQSELARAESDYYGRPSHRGESWNRRNEFMNLVYVADFEKTVLEESDTPEKHMPTAQSIIDFYSARYK